MSDNPDFPDAPATAPGGMAKAALREELRNKHGYGVAALADMSWPEMITATIEARKEREAEAKHVRENPPLFIGMPDTKDFGFDGHAGASPSGAERWMNCTASLEAARAFLETLTPNQQAQFASANTAARQGTTAHAAAETEVQVMLGTVSTEEANNTLMELAILPETEGEAYDETMAEYITEYVDLVKQYADAGHDILVEQRVEAAVPLTNGEVYEIRGSADFIAMPTAEDNALVVGDLKYGNGIDVDVDENPQIRIYALGALSQLADDEGNLPELDEVIYHIIQPRLGGIKTWQESVDDLLDWRDEVLSPALSMALAGTEGGATYSPSELACQWCPAKGSCAALAEQRMSSAKELFDVITEAEFADGPGAFPETGALTNEHLGALLKQVEGLTKIKDDLRAEAQRRLYRGTQVPGYQLVSYTPPRKWDDDAAEVLHPGHGGVLTDEQAEALWSKKLMTPTQALAALKKAGVDGEALIGNLIVAPDKRPVIAPEGDRRKAWGGVPPEQMFDVEKEES